MRCGDVNTVEHVAVAPGEGAPQAETLSGFDVFKERGREQLLVSLNVIGGVLFGHPEKQEDVREKVAEMEGSRTR